MIVKKSIRLTIQETIGSSVGSARHFESIEVEFEVNSIFRKMIKQQGRLNLRQ